MKKKNEHEEEANYWYNNSMIFARALAMFLRDDEGIVVSITPGVSFPLEDDVDKVIVYYKNGNVSIMPCYDDFDEGELVIIPDYNPN